MGVRITTNVPFMRKMLSDASLERARYVLANQAMSDMDKFVPLKSSALVNSAHLDANYNIVYTTPYAKAQFYGKINGYPIKNYTQTPGRYPTKRWDLRAKALYGDAWAKKVGQNLLGGN